MEPAYSAIRRLKYVTNKNFPMNFSQFHSTQLLSLPSDSSKAPSPRIDSNCPQFLGSAHASRVYVAPPPRASIHSQPELQFRSHRFSHFSCQLSAVSFSTF